MSAPVPASNTNRLSRLWDILWWLSNPLKSDQGARDVWRWWGEHVCAYHPDYSRLQRCISNETIAKDMYHLYRSGWVSRKSVIRYGVRRLAYTITPNGRRLLLYRVLSTPSSRLGGEST